MKKDISADEFGAAWSKLKKEGFEHAFVAMAEMDSQAKVLGHTKDCEELEKATEKMQKVLENPTEKLDLY